MEQTENKLLDATDKTSTDQKAVREKQKNFPVKTVLIILMILTILNTIAIIDGAFYLYNRKPSMIFLGAAGTEKNESSPFEKRSLAKKQIKLLLNAIVAYKKDMGRYPDAKNWQQALTDDSGKNKEWRGPYVKTDTLKDPWGNDYVYTVPGKNADFDIVCYGADGLSGGDGSDADITSYESY